SSITARLPSAPTSSLAKSSPATFLRHALPVSMIDPSASTALSAATWSPVTPYFTQHAPPALVATLPPIEQMARDDGSGAYHRPCSTTAAARSPLSTPGSAVAVRWATSTSRTRFIAAVDNTMHPSMAL